MMVGKSHGTTLPRPEWTVSAGTSNDLPARVLYNNGEIDRCPPRVGD
jgi:hypothetical protein